MWVCNYKSVGCKHYKAMHPKLPCPHCSMTFNSSSSRQRHMYMYKELKHECTRCAKWFPFKSAFKNHQITHQRHPTQHCDTEGGSCGKWFYMVVKVARIPSCVVYFAWNTRNCTLNRALRQVWTQPFSLSRQLQDLSLGPNVAISDVQHLNIEWR